MDTNADPSSSTANAGSKDDRSFEENGDSSQGQQATLQLQSRDQRYGHLPPFRLSSANYGRRSMVAKIVHGSPESTDEDMPREHALWDFLLRQSVGDVTNQGKILVYALKFAF